MPTSVRNRSYRAAHKVKADSDGLAILSVTLSYLKSKVKFDNVTNLLSTLSNAGEMSNNAKEQLCL
jgi:hypothetical protein